MDIEEMRRRASHALADIVPRSEDTAAVEWERHSLSSADFPVPGLIIFGLRDLRGLKSWGPGEKFLWHIDADFGSIPFSVALEKFGLRVYLPKGLPDNTKAELLRRLESAAKLSETFLRDVAEQQVAAGNVTIENQYLRFDRAYQFFREKAREAYETPPPQPRVTHRDKEGRPAGWSSNPLKPEIEGGYLAAAMVDTYFSRLEHLLVLVLPFLEFDPSAGNLVRFVGLTWDEKWRQVFDVAQDSAAKLNYDQLKHIKETVRNPASHGGFTKKGTSFYFHVEEIGALPALLTKHRRSFELSITRVPQPTYHALCSQLDGVDAFLLASNAAPGVKYAQAGLDVVFSADFRKAYKAAAVSPRTLEEFMDHQAYLDDRHRNMDY